MISDIAKHIRFRLVEKKDAAFILSLRLDPEKNRFISPVENDIKAQEQWIDDYRAREIKQEEFYFIIESHDGEKLGTIRLYDFRGDSFCWGSWILKQDAPPYASLESVLSIYEIAIKRLGFKQSHTDVRKGNTPVKNFLLQFGAEITAEDDINCYFRMTSAAFEKARNNYRRFLLSHG
ncbi:MAG: GNAT family N-acetyltransferase [Chlorobium limicola]|nr:GNAT family N-acetyltransferase [Chlorobium limicola]